MPYTLFKPEIPGIAEDLPVRKVTMDDHNKINGKQFAMQRIDMKQQVSHAEYWDVTNTNSKEHGMLHPFHIHGTHFTVVSRDGEDRKSTRLNSSHVSIAYAVFC